MIYLSIALCHKVWGLWAELWKSSDLLGLAFFIFLATRFGPDLLRNKSGSVWRSSGQKAYRFIAQASEGSSSRYSAARVTHRHKDKSTGVFVFTPFAIIRVNQANLSMRFTRIWKIDDCIDIIWTNGRPFVPQSPLSRDLLEDIYKDKLRENYAMVDRIRLDVLDYCQRTKRILYLHTYTRVRTTMIMFANS